MNKSSKSKSMNSKKYNELVSYVASYCNFYPNTGIFINPNTLKYLEGDLNNTYFGYVLLEKSLVLTQTMTNLTCSYKAIKATIKKIYDKGFEYEENVYYSHYNVNPQGIFDKLGTQTLDGWYEEALIKELDKELEKKAKRKAKKLVKQFLSQVKIAA